MVLRALQQITRLLPSNLWAHLNRGTVLTYGAVLLIAGAVVALGLTSWHMRQDAIDSAIENTGNLATVLAAETARSVQAVDIVLHELQERIASAHISSAEQFRSEL